MRMHVSSRVLIRVSTAVVLSVLGVGATGMHTVAWAGAQTRALPLTARQIGAITGLAPGGAAQAVNYAIVNPNTSPAYVGAVAISITGIAYVTAAGTGTGTTWDNHPAGGAAPGCAAANFAVVAPTPITQSLPSGETSSTRLASGKTGTVAMVDTRVNQDNCRGVTVTLAVAVA